MSISVAIVTHNEEKNIIHCLQSVYGWADEIVIVDGASTDNTVKLIKDFHKKEQVARDGEPRKARIYASRRSTFWGCQVTESAPLINIILSDNPPMFHINKQKAIEACSSEWILQLDADEEVSSELKEEIIQMTNPKSESLNPKQFQNPNDKNIKQKNRKPIVTNPDLIGTNSTNPDGTVGNQLSEAGLIQPIAYWVPRLNFFLGKPLRKGGQYPDYTIRLYRNGIARFPCKSVHENVEIVAMGVPKRGAPNKPQFPPIRRDEDLFGAVEGQAPSQPISTNSNHQSEAGPTSPQAGPIQPSIGYLTNPLLHYPYPTFKEYLNKWHRYNQLEAQKLKKQGIKPSVSLFINYVLIKPPVWFFSTYLRHKGFMDGIPGFVFSFFSSIRYKAIFFLLIKNQ